MVYAVCKCANEVEAFRYRFLDGKIVLFDKIDTAFTYLNQDTELFKVVNVPMQDTMRNTWSWQQKPQGNKKNILPDPWEMMFFNVLLCRG